MTTVRLKPGYKRTAVGVLPEDWGVVPLDSVAKRGSGHTPSKKHPEYWGGGIKWLSLRDSEQLDALYIFDTAAKITTAGVANSSAVIHPAGTVVLSRDAGVGKSAITGDDMAVSQHFIAWKCGPSLNNHFLYYWLQSKKSEFERVAIGNTIKTIGLPYFRQLSCPLPLKTEQEVIANVLSDADALIESLEQLIAKKRHLKQGAMQELLTGKRRLPGFSDKWQIKRIGEIFSISSGSSKSKYINDGGPYWVVDMGSVLSDGKFVATKPTNYEGDFLEAGDLVMPKDDIGGGNIIGRVGYIGQDNKYILGDHVYALKAKLGCSLFLSYVINGHPTNNALKKKVSGSAQLGLSRKSVEEQDVPFPPVDEQTAIVAVLSDVDAEIAALEEKRDKMVAIKQGTMQDLLTGRTRLV